MREVIFKKWIPREWDSENNKVKDGTNCFSDFIYRGVFHQWGHTYQEFDSGVGNLTIAIIEQASGDVFEVLPINMKFVN